MIDPEMLTRVSRRCRNRKVAAILAWLLLRVNCNQPSAAVHTSIRNGAIPYLQGAATGTVGRVTLFHGTAARFVTVALLPRFQTEALPKIEVRAPSKKGRPR